MNKCQECGAPDGYVSGIKLERAHECKRAAMKSSRSPAGSTDFVSRLRIWVNMVDVDAAHPSYTKHLLKEAADLIEKLSVR